MADVSNQVREIRASSLGKQTRKPIADALENIHGGPTESMATVNAKLATRISKVAVSAVVDDDYCLVLTRANGQ